MTRNEFLLELDEVLNLPAGTLKGHEQLGELKNWDSTFLITFVALAETSSGVNISPAQIVKCSTVGDLLQLAHVETVSS